MEDRDIVSYNHADALLAYTQSLLSQGQFCDVTVNLDGQFVARCHRLLLAAMSAHLESMFVGVDDSPAITVDVDSKLTGIQFDDLKNCVDYFYQGRIMYSPTLYMCACTLGCEALAALVSGRDNHNGDVIEDPNHANRLLIEIRRLYLEGKFTDVALSVQGYSTQAHSCHRIVLSAFSQHLETALQRTENNANVILEIDPTCTGVSNTDLRTIIDFMYYGMLRIVKRKVKALLYAAKALNVHKMLEMLTVTDPHRSVTYTTRAGSEFGQDGLNFANDYDMHPVSTAEDVGANQHSVAEVEMSLNVGGDGGVLAKEDDYMELYEEYVSGPRKGRKYGSYGPRRDNLVTVKQQLPAKISKEESSKGQGEDVMLTGVVVDGVVGVRTEEAASLTEASVKMTVVPAHRKRNHIDSYGYGLPEFVGANDVTVPLLVGDQQKMMEKPFKCPYCDHRTREKSAIEKHIRCIHTLEAPYKCMYCNQAFKVQSNLVRHIRAHTGEKPYVCKKCGAAYADKKNMDAHVFREHLKMVPLQCPAVGCSAKFWRQDRYDFHCRKSHNFDPAQNDADLVG